MHRLTDSIAALLPGTPYALIDVRSETEYEQSGIPGFVSLPLLYQNERSQVGLCYKTQGQAAAISLGHQLVDPHREERVQAWGDRIKTSPSQQGLLMCWRGGLRSQIATQWIREAGFAAEQLPGGYKKIRQSFLSILQDPPALIVLSGLTGSGKTELLREFQNHGLDLEAAARHRGSAFGGLQEAQPAQTRFENAVALALSKSPMLVEDESRLLGQRAIPERLYQAMLEAPRIYLEAGLEERIERIYAEYVLLPLDQGFDYPALQKLLLTSLEHLKRRLDKDYGSIREQLLQALAQPPALGRHTAWIESLLRLYYDRLYTYAAQKQGRSPVFSGNREACRDWLKERLKVSC